MRKRLVIVLLLALLGGSAFSQTLTYRETRLAVETMLGSGALRLSGADVRAIASAGGAAVGRFAVRAGRAVPYVGTALFAYSAIDAAIQWNRTRSQPLMSGIEEIDCQVGVGPECGTESIPPASRTGEWPTAGGNVRWASGSIYDAFGNSVGSFDFTVSTRSLPHLPEYGDLLYRAYWSYSVGASGCNVSGYTPGYHDWPSQYYNQAAINDFWHQVRSAVLACIPGAGSFPALETILATSAVGSQWAANVLNDYLQDKAQSGSYPETYGAPIAGVTFDPAPNINQWYDNPYANPALDTDGDGYVDWKEVVVGTDPTDATSVPAMDPEAILDEGALTDTDGDGIPDIYDPCPFDALNRCADNAEVEWPTDYALETTAQAILTEVLTANQLLAALDIDTSGMSQEDIDALANSLRTGMLDDFTDIADLVASTGATVLDELEEVQETLDEIQLELMEAEAVTDFDGLGGFSLDAWEPGDLTSGVYDQLATQISDIVSASFAAAETKLPFVFSGWVPVISLGGGSVTCEPIYMTILGSQQDVSICNSPVHTVLATTVRTALLAVMILGFWLGMTRWVATT